LSAPPAPGVRLTERNTLRSSRVSMIGIPSVSTDLRDLPQKPSRA